MDFDGVVISDDVGGAVAPLADLYKTQVWQLAEAVGVPKNIIEKRPSA